MVKKKTKLFTALGMSTILLVGAASAYAAQKEENEVVQTTEKAPITTKVKETNAVPTSTEIESVLKGEPAPANSKVEGLFSRDGKPDYTADYFLNDENLISLLKISTQQLKEELATGKSVVEIAESRNVSKQQLIDVIAKTQVDAQIQAENKGEVPKSNSSMKKDIEKKVVQVIEHKTETEWNK